MVLLWSHIVDVTRTPAGQSMVDSASTSERLFGVVRREPPSTPLQPPDVLPDRSPRGDPGGTQIRGTALVLPSSGPMWSFSKFLHMSAAARCFVSKSAGFSVPRTFLTCSFLAFYCRLEPKVAGLQATQLAQVRSVNNPACCGTVRIQGDRSLHTQVSKHRLEPQCS